VSDLATLERIIVGQCIGSRETLELLPDRGRSLFRHEPEIRTCIAALFYWLDIGEYDPETNLDWLAFELDVATGSEESGWWHWLDDMRGVCATPIDTHLSEVVAIYAREDAFTAAMQELLKHGEAPAPGDIQPAVRHEIATDQAFRR
jgi:hypothetical protein